MHQPGHSAFRLPYAAFGIAFAALCATHAATWYASPTGTAEADCTEGVPGTIAAAIAKAADGTSWEDGDEIALLAGTYDYSDPVWSKKNCVNVPANKNYLTIRSTSANPADAILLGRGSETYVSEDLLTTNSPFYARAIYTSSHLRLQGVTVTNFYHTEGPAASASSAGLLLLEDCVVAGNSGAAATYRVAATRTLFRGNVSPNSGGAASKATELRDCVFEENVAKAGGAIHGSTLAEGCVFIGNSSTGNGGAAYEVAALTNCRFLRNSASSYGGALYKGSCTNCVFVDNTAASGGAIYEARGLAGSCFTNNAATTGGAVFSDNNATYRVDNCEFVRNVATSGGGAMRGHSLLSVFDSVFIENSAPLGGANFSGGNYYNCLFVGNTASRSGGALHYGVARNCRFIGNQSVEYGGATYQSEAYGCHFEQNSCVGGGTVYGDRKNVSECSFYFNTASSYVIAYGPILQNCLAVSNETSTTHATSCGLVYNYSPVNCTFIGNRAAGANGSGVLTVASVNCLLHANLPKDIGSPSRTFENCLYETTASSGSTYRDCVQTSDPKFNLGRNRRIGWYAPRRSSPAVNAGLEQSWAAGTFDLAGNPRLNGPIDIGCYESWPSQDGTTIFMR